MAAKKRSTKPARPGLTHMGALRRVDPAKWEREVRKAMKAAEGRVPEAAEALGVSARTVFLWLEEPCFVDVERASVGAPRKG